MKIFFVFVGDSRGEMLTPLGVRQAYKTADFLTEYFKEHGMEPKKACTVHSDEKNTSDCTKIIFDMLGPKKCFEADWLEENSHTAHTELARFYMKCFVEGFEAIVVVGHQRQLMDIVYGYEKQLSCTMQSICFYRGGVYKIDVGARSIGLIFYPEQER
ncbi:MAG: hypothetical protein COU47_01900 [Candidatus Niyogibacteria bacterium CG10_big_fil_rev_8_21_14_0_10_46_36]|uniref:Histidine phosphatase family protein n=1 Tax=Candidatus Niyogibacteria bacterium CG10_big_fil_rev_8_21_14_0_10_46_36 TaxID=1974726 RepID=A0A2H0TDM6_9BACT|nr:MAG: hypothetical protein COU47_01900 [Candidatus Niyogibacteria bacterium CG10_big_fil_rev_8_21_14_0_10_46_36]